MARRKAERPAERGARRAETNAVAAYLTALRAPKAPARSRAKLEQRRAQIEEWLSEESSPIREVELIQQRLDIYAQLAQADQAQRLAELEEAFVKVAASWGAHSWNRRGTASVAQPRPLRSRRYTTRRTLLAHPIGRHVWLRFAPRLLRKRRGRAPNGRSVRRRSVAGRDRGAVRCLAPRRDGRPFWCR
jgi:hypothetical protein